ncbi:hypothetical protein [Deefgea rivuli]|uniref:hypothetical protein n=1 Tax=Deefgea rivuli TaxID=400948 RepID=UPI000483717E|nr:hypothetical protein [Deefgea rivuli]
MNLYQTRIPAPQDWQQLQRITADFYKSKFSDCTVDEYGTHGQAQDGVDVYIYNETTAVGVQCKCVETFTADDLANEFDKTKSFKNPLKHYIIVVTVKRDTRLVNKAVELMLSSKRGIRIEVKFWQPLVEELAGNESLANRYLNFAVRIPVHVEANGASALIALETEDSRFEFVATKMASFKGKFEKQDNLILVTSLQGEKKAHYHSLGNGHWTDFHKVIGVTKLDAFATWVWFSRFSNFEEISETSGDVQNILFTNDELNRIRCA